MHKEIDIHQLGNYLLRQKSEEKVLEYEVIYRPTEFNTNLTYGMFVSI